MAVVKHSRIVFLCNYLVPEMNQADTTAHVFNRSITTQFSLISSRLKFTVKWLAVFGHFRLYGFNKCVHLLAPCGRYIKTER